jgi:hypothetical protein
MQGDRMKCHIPIFTTALDRSVLFWLVDRQGNKVEKPYNNCNIFIFSGDNINGYRTVNHSQKSINFNNSFDDVCFIQNKREFFDVNVARAVKHKNRFTIDTCFHVQNLSCSLNLVVTKTIIKVTAT